MMKSLWVQLSFVLFSAMALAQWDGLNPPVDQRTRTRGYPTSRPPSDCPSSKDLSKMETKLWKARISGTASFIRQNISEDAKVATSTGAANKNELIAQVETGTCRIRSYRLEDFVVKLSTPAAAEISYRAEQDAVCNGKSLPRTVAVNATYLKRQGKWWHTAYEEAAVTPTAPSGKSPN